MRRLIARDEGATIVLIAIVLVVLLGLVGLAVDAAALYQERRELRNGADAAVLAVAEDCALEARPCTDAVAWSTAAAYADLNARDGASGIQSVDLDLDAQTVRVVTHTVVAATGGDQIEPFFMQLLGVGGTRVIGDATAQWGVPRSLTNIVPLAVSRCEWPGALPYETTIYVHGTEDDVDECHALPGFDEDGDGLLPGGFGWLENEKGCILDVEVPGWYQDEPGVALPNDCKDLIEVGATIWVPWFSDADGVEGTGGTGRYYLQGFGAFVIESYRFPGHRSPGAPPCGGNEFCIHGTFVKAAAHSGEFGTGPSFGIVLIKLID